MLRSISSLALVLGLASAPAFAATYAAPAVKVNTPAANAPVANAPVKTAKVAKHHKTVATRANKNRKH